ncbi:MAG: hypothetical protein IKE43_09460 [Coriobacteriales bacterium]|nr:hypothetical protein [Coriobacteriales bacterium]
MEIRTNWGYTAICEWPELPPLLRVDEFLTISGLEYSSSMERIAQVIAGVSQAVRDWCGWHVAPALDCVFVASPDGHFVELPCMGVVDVESVTKNDTELAYEWRGEGLVRLVRPEFGWRSVTVRYRAGYTDSSALAMAVAQIVENKLVAAPGVREEHAGQVGISYNQTASGVSGGVRLLESDYALLQAYRIPRGA